jgi:hypothetical protein
MVLMRIHDVLMGFDDVIWFDRDKHGIRIIIGYECVYFR